MDWRRHVHQLLVLAGAAAVLFNLEEEQKSQRADRDGHVYDNSIILETWVLWKMASVCFQSPS
jgi:hypothetical protein